MELTVFMGKDRGADGARPHPEGRGELAGHLGVTCQMLSKATLIDVKLAANWTWVICLPPFSCEKRICKSVHKH